MMKMVFHNITKRRVKWLLPICLFVFLPLNLHAQGIPFIKNFSSNDYKAHNQNFDIISGQDGTIYVANFEGLLYYENARWHILHTRGVTRITAVFCDSKGVIWTGGYNYIGYVKADEQGRLRLQDIDENDIFQGEVQWIWEENDTIYFKINDDTKYAIANNHVQLAPDAKLPSSGFSVYRNDEDIVQVQELEEGLKALATNGEGVIIVDKNNKELFRITEQNGLCSNNISHITYNRHGLIWGATDNGLFVIGFPSIYSHFTQYEGLRGEVLTLAIMDNIVYAGTLSGLYFQNGKEFKHFKSISRACWQLAHQDSGLLAATSDGVYRISSDGSCKQLTKANTLSLMVDKDGFYSGEMDGVYYNTKTERKKVCNYEKIVKIIRDKNGVIWLENLYGMIWSSFKPFINHEDAEAMGTLVEYKGDVLTIFTNTQKPFPYPTFSYADSEGVLWLNDNKGKNIYAYENGFKNQKLSSVVSPLRDYPIRSMVRKDNLLWMGGDKGINVVDYTRREPSKALDKPKVIIRSILLREDSVLWGGYSALVQPLTKLPSDENQIIFTFSTDYPSLLHRTQYRTRINDGRWSAWDTSTFEEYTNLSSGKHVFEVQALDAFGQMSDIVTVDFSIDAPFYLRWYMQLLYCVLFILLIYQITRWRMKQLKKEKRRLENIVQERTAEVVKQKDEIEEKSKNLENALHDLGEAQHELVRQEKMATVGKLTQGLIDRILNPLNYINNFAKLSEGLVNDVTANIEDEKEHMAPDNYEDTVDLLDMLKSNIQKVGEHGANTSRTLKAMEEMLKDRSGKIVEMNLTMLLHQNEEMVKKYYEKEISQYHIKTIFDIPAEDIIINGNAEQLSKTFMSMLSNAIYAVIKKMQREHNAIHPEIKMTAEVKDKMVSIKFYDNGIGIESTIIDKIFDPFFTTKTTSEASGVGLYLSREIAQNHGGDICVQSQKNVYTEFTITLPTL